MYRYDKLNQCNSDTQAEKSNVEKVLESGISNAKYIWHSEKGEHTCEKCRALDGKVFEFYDEVPERPHPNCKCTVEIVVDSKILSTPWNTPYLPNTSINDYTIQNFLKEYNHKQNEKYKDALLLMDIALSDFDNISDTNEFIFLNKKDGTYNKNVLNNIYNMKIPENLNGIFFLKNSHLANSLSDSNELKKQITVNVKNNKDNHFSVTLKDDENLHRAINKAEIYYDIDKDGYFSGLLYDIYDFELLKGSIMKDSELTLEAKNNAAYLLQQLGIIKKYYIIVPIKMKI